RRTAESRTLAVHRVETDETTTTMRTSVCVCVREKTKPVFMTARWAVMSKVMAPRAAAWCRPCSTTIPPAWAARFWMVRGMGVGRDGEARAGMMDVMVVVKSVVVVVRGLLVD